MRRLLSVGALLAASTLTLWHPQPAEAARVVIVVGHHRHHRHHRYYRHGYYGGYYR